MENDVKPEIPLIPKNGSEKKDKRKMTKPTQFEVIDMRRSGVAKKIRKAKVVLFDRGGTQTRKDSSIEELLLALDARRESVKTLFECLSAMRTYYNVFAKKMVTEPDYATRQAASKTLLAYDV